MEYDVLKTYILSITAAGFLIMVAGAIFYFFRNEISGNARYLLPIPPLGVAAYIFVFNMFDHYGGNLPQGTWNTAKEILYSVAFSAIVFGFFTVLLIVLVGYLKR